jgi:hypothetical protein
MGEYFLTTEKFLETFTDMGLRDEYYFKEHGKIFDVPKNLFFICDCKIFGKDSVKLSNDAKYTIVQKNGVDHKQLVPIAEKEKIWFNVDRILRQREMEIQKIHGEN